MPLPVIGDVFRVALRWHNDDTLSDAVNVMHFFGNGLTPADVATALDASLAANMWVFQDQHSKITEIDITPLDGSSTTFPYIPTPGAKYAGVQSAEDNSPQVANIVKFVTDKRGRSYRGRVYLPWVVDSGQTNGVLNPTDLASCNTAWVAFKTGMTTHSCPLVVASYKLESYETVIAVQAEKFTATQRRRQKRTSA